jgi:hypothetical protein
MEVSATSSRDPIVSVVGRGTVRRILILVLVRIWSRSVLYQKHSVLQVREYLREDNTRHRCHCRRSERRTLLRVSPNAVVTSHTIDIWARHAIALVLNA